MVIYWILNRGKNAAVQSSFVSVKIANSMPQCTKLHHLSWRHKNHCVGAKFSAQNFIVSHSTNVELLINFDIKWWQKLNDNSTNSFWSTVYYLVHLELLFMFNIWHSNVSTNLTLFLHLTHILASDLLFDVTHVRWLALEFDTLSQALLA